MNKQSVRGNRYGVAAVIVALLVLVPAAGSAATGPQSECRQIPPVVPKDEVPSDVRFWAGPDDSVVGGGGIWTQRQNIPPRNASWTRDKVTGTYSLKFPWFLSPPKLKEVPVVTGRRVDGPGEFTASVNAAFSRGPWASSGLYFSTKGCWEVTGAYGASTLTFRIRVG